VICLRCEVGYRGTDGKFPYSESLQSLGAKRSISHEHQKSSRLSRFPVQASRGFVSRPLGHQSDGRNQSIFYLLTAITIRKTKLVRMS
jgi:hypothetical protein